MTTRDRIRGKLRARRRREPDGFAPMRTLARRYHMHTPGLVYVGTVLLLALGAFKSGNNLLFLAFGAAVAGLIVSGFLSGLGLMGIQIEREPMSDGVVGRPLRVSYRVRNRNRVFPVFALDLSEGGERKQEWSVVQGEIAAFAVHVPPRGEVRVSATLSPERRGELALDRLAVSTTYPFGLTRKSITFAARDRAVIFPRMLDLAPGLIDRLASTDARAVAAGRAVGVGAEFYGLREFRDSDSPRQIAWRASARTGELLVRQTSAVRPVRVWVRLNRVDSPAYREAAISLAASLLGQAHDRGWSAGLLVPFAGVRVPPGSGRRSYREMLRVLALLDMTPHEASDSFAGRGPMPGDAVIDVGLGVGPPGDPRPSFMPRAVRLDVAATETYLAPGAAPPVLEPSA